jgi:hypothetical protein
VLQSSERLLGLVKTALQLHELRGVFGDGRVTKGFQRFQQLRSAHGDLCASLLQGSVTPIRWRCAEACQGSLRRIWLRSRSRGRHASPLLPGQALGLASLFFALYPVGARVEAMPSTTAFDGSGGSLRLIRGVTANERHGVRRQRKHVDAVDRAGGNAQVAARALVNDDGVHQFGGANDGVHRAGLNALGATDALCLTDESHLRRRAATLDIELQDGHIEQSSQRCNGLIATGWTLVDGFAGRHALGVRLATWMAALPALSLRQQGVDALNQAHAWTRSTTRAGRR